MTKLPLNHRKALLTILSLCLITGLALAQRPGRGGGRHNKATVDAPPEYDNNLPKLQKDLSGRFTFARIRFDTSSIAHLYGYNLQLGDGGPPWSHDYPAAGRHLMKIIAETSKTDVTLDINEPIFSFDNPELFKYPFVYLCEVGWMNLSDKEIAGMREYLLRGGFILVDDFRSPREFYPFQMQVKRAMPELELKKLDLSHPVFNCFFSIKTLELPPVYGGQGLNPEFWGLEDETGRLMMVVNYNYDASDYWQFSDNPFRPIEETNDAYKFGVNYIVYALTH
jgi:hypothetical protein